MPTLLRHPQAKRWCFTLNNPTQDDAAHVRSFAESDDCEYLIFGREIGANGTRHLQGFCIFRQRQRLSGVRRFVSPRGHFEVARGTSIQARDYCKKDGDFEEFGALSTGTGQGKRSDLEAFRDWVVEFPTKPTARDIAVEHPAIFLRYRTAALDLIEHLYPKPVLVVNPVLRPWQLTLDEYLESEPDDRTVKFYVDHVGNSGKSWFIRYFFSTFPDKVQRLSVGKRDDLAFSIDPTKSVFLFDIPRTQMQFFQYSVLEQLKDRMIFSPKYHSQTKILAHKCHVVVFSNEDPDREAMSRDRYSIVQLRRV